ncbi:hypothetical protein SLH49_12380 [Cognatiyoonia sp. IB215446]|uniref:hypothetical protein n=1 Tax=Cognatiyoonia sp. IB215446 TaxID=3097355 RepID=UPI002A0D6645|nr:hypothetical protein [Cognatiyoonia sp. IB215446]MDX8348778.1 hypothetical protein [Cognatiyoonia sp. IB215446]
MRALFLAVALAGCATAPLAPEGTDFIEVLSGSSFIGQATQTIYANNTLKREVLEPNEPDVTVVWVTLPDGTYAAARAIVERDFPTITAPDFDLCPTDMGVDSITLSQPVADREFVLGGCGENGYYPLRAELLALLPEWPDS